MEFEVRVASGTDGPAISDLLQESYHKLMASAYDSATLQPALEMMTKANPILLASGTYYVAKVSTGQLVGCGGWTREQPGTGKVEPHVAHIRHFATHPDWTRLGIGRAIYQACENAARSVGIRAFECYSSLNAESFYAAFGFKTIKATKVAFANGKGFPAIWMRYDLDH